MKLKITHLKAPWPQGAVIGDVLELDQVPGWALGKCERVADDAEVTVSLAPVEFVANVPPTVVVSGPFSRESLAEVASALEGGDVIEATDSSNDAVEFVKATSRDEMEAEAKALGVSFNVRTSDETLAARIAEAKQ